MAVGPNKCVRRKVVCLAVERLQGRSGPDWTLRSQTLDETSRRFNPQSHIALPITLDWRFKDRHLQCPTGIKVGCKGVLLFVGLRSNTEKLDLGMDRDASVLYYRGRRHG